MLGDSFPGCSFVGFGAICTALPVLGRELIDQIPTFFHDLSNDLEIPGIKIVTTSGFRKSIFSVYTGRRKRLRIEGAMNAFMKAEKLVHQIKLRFNADPCNPLESDSFLQDYLPVAVLMILWTSLPARFITFAIVPPNIMPMRTIFNSETYTCWF